MHQHIRLLGITLMITALAFCLGQTALAQTPVPDARPETFVGTWYGSCFAPLKIEIAMKGGELDATVLMLGNKTKATAVPVESIVIKGDTLRLQGLHFMGPGQAMDIELRVPKDDLVCTFVFSESMARQNIPEMTFAITKDSPKLAEKFADAKIVTPEEMNSGSQSASCQNNLKQLGLIMKMYAGERKNGEFPKLDPRAGYLVFNMADIFPEYLTDCQVLLCPSDQKAQEGKPEPQSQNAQWFFDTSSYWYLGYAAPDEETGLAFIEAYKQQAANNQGFEQDLLSPDGKNISRLKEGIERFYVTDINNPAAAAQIQSQMPVVICRPGSHGDETNVLFMDGHVEKIKYPGKYPMTEKFIEGLKSLDALRK